MTDTLHDDRQRPMPAPVATPTTMIAGAGWGWILAYGLLSVALGVAAFAWPFAATLAATLVVGAFFAATGIVSIVAGVTGRGFDARGYAIGFGVVSLLIGLVMAFEPATGAFSLTVMVTLWLVVRGAMEIAFGLRMRRRKATMILLGIVNLVLAGFVLATLPLAALTLPGYILGISFVFGGVSSIAGALAHCKGDPAFTIG